MLSFHTVAMVTDDPYDDAQHSRMSRRQQWEQQQLEDWERRGGRMSERRDATARLVLTLPVHRLCTV